jgi:hypothetical protein
MLMSRLTRRDFVRTGAYGVATFSTGRALGANDDIRLAFIGVRLRGSIAGSSISRLPDKAPRSSALSAFQKKRPPVAAGGRCAET